MIYPKIYLGPIPSTVEDRRVLRRQALNLRNLLRTPQRADPTYLLMHFFADDRAGQQIDLLLLLPNAIIVGIFWEHSDPIEVRPGVVWLDRRTGLPIVSGISPLQRVEQQRNIVRNLLHTNADRLIERSYGQQPFEQTIGALICPAAAHPDSRISLDINDHLQRLKILAPEELRGFVAMVQTGVQLSEEIMQAIVVDLFAGNLWHNGTDFAFELAPFRFQLRVLEPQNTVETILPLMEGENILGRRRSSMHDEHRLTITGDDLVSSDHAQLIDEGKDAVLLRDTSKNGTWLTLPDGRDELLRSSERMIVPGTVIRIGVTQLRLEDVQREE